jgi:hypothetical protein
MSTDEGIAGMKKRAFSELSWPKLLIPLVAIVAIATHIIWPDLKIDTIALGLLAAALLPWLPVFVESVKLPGGAEVKLRKIEEQQVQTQIEVEQLRFLVSHLLTDEEFRILTTLEKGESWEVPEDEHRSSSPIIGSLRRLVGSNFIERTFPSSFSKFHRKEGPADIAQHFRITEIGKKYVTMRRQIDSRQLQENAL